MAAIFLLCFWQAVHSYESNQVHSLPTLPACPDRAVVRDPQKAEACFACETGATTTLKDVTVKERLELVKGDVTDPESLKTALAGCKGVVFAASGRGYWSADSVDFKASPLAM